MDDLNVVTLDLAAGDGLAELKAAIETAGKTKESDLIVVRTTSEANALTYADSDDQLGISIDSALYGSLTIVGLGDSPLILDANQKTNVVSIENYGEINFANMTFTNGYAKNGGGIYANKGTVRIIDSFITNNTASSFGGGICHYGGALTAAGCVIRNNSGDGIYSDTTDALTVENSKIMLNTGSGISIANGTKLLVANSAIYANREAGVSASGDNVLTLTNSTVVGNGTNGVEAYIDGAEARDGVGFTVNNSIATANGGRGEGAPQRQSESDELYRRNQRFPISRFFEKHEDRRTGSRIFVPA